MAYENLYDKKVFYKLIVRGVERFVNEPIGWSDVKIILDRDPEFYGFNYEFLDPKIKLDFIPGEGFEELKIEYDTYKGEGDVLFLFGIVDNNVQDVIYRGRLNFNNYDETADGITCPIETQAFESLWRTRYETAFDLNATTDADGNTITPPTPVVVKLHSKRIIKQTLSIIDPEHNISNESDFVRERYRAWLLPDFTNLVSDEIKGITGTSAGYIVEGPVESDAFVWDVEESGPVVIKISASFNGKYEAFRKYPETMLTGFSVVPVFIIKRGGVVIEEYYINERKVDVTNQVAFWISEGAVIIPEIILNRDVVAGDEVYLAFLTTVYNVSSGDALIIFRFSDYINTIAIQQQSELPPSTCNAYRYGDALKHCILCATGKPDAIVSNFIDDYADDFLITNGFQVRKFQIDTRPVQTSIKALLTGAQASWNIGVGFRDTADGQVADLELMADFFKEAVILKIDEVWDYGEVHAKDYVFNELEIGYNKFKDGDLNTLDEFNTLHSRLFPVKTYKSKKTIKSNFVTAGYSLEELRREQYAENPSTSLTNDDEIFCIDSVTGARKYEGIYWKTLPGSGEVSFGKNVELEPGQTFYITGGKLDYNAATLFTVVSKNGAGAQRYFITPTSFADEADTTALAGWYTGKLTLTISGTEAAKDEKFGDITNLYSPETSYNLRMAPLFMLYAWASNFNIFLQYKGASEKIKATIIKQNKALTTVTNNNDKIVPNGIFTQGQDVDLSAYNRGNQKVTPTICNFKCNLTFEDFLKLKRKLRGEGADTPELNKGCIQHPDYNGVQWLSHVLRLEMNPTTQVAEMKVVKIKSL